MSIIIVAAIILILAAMLVYAVDYLPIEPPFNGFIKALIVVGAVAIIAQKAGLF